MKNLIFTFVEVLLIFAFSVTLSFVFSLSIPFGTNTVLFFVLPIVFFTRVFMLKASISPLEKRNKELEKLTSEQDNVIKKFLMDETNDNE